MKRTTCYLVAAVLAWSITATPARADEAAPAAGSATGAAGSVLSAAASETLLGTLDTLYSSITPTVTDMTLLASATQSVSPMSSYFTILGFIPQTGTASTAASGDTAGAVAQNPAQPPNLAMLATGPIYVGNGGYAAIDNGSAAPTSSPVLAPLTTIPVTPSDLTPVPLPPALFLLGSGLLGLLSVRPALSRAV